MPQDEDSPFLTFIGIDDLQSKDGAGSVSLEVKPHHLQAAGRVHGGLLAVLADTAGYRAIRSLLLPGQGTTTVELKVNFLKGAESGRLTAQAEVVSQSDSLMVVEMNVSDQDGQLVAQCLSTYLIIDE